jgi:hypothetical protein
VCAATRDALDVETTSDTRMPLALDDDAMAQCRSLDNAL